jgi:HEAT repeat protein
MPDDLELEQHLDQIDAYAGLIETIGREVGERFDPAVVRALTYSFGLGDGFEVYWTTLHLIERFSGHQTTYALIQEAVAQGAAGVRKWGCFMLGRRRNPTDLPVLLSRLADPEPRVVVEALRAIERIAQEHDIAEAIPAVQPLIAHACPDIAIAAHEALASLRS